MNVPFLYVKKIMNVIFVDQLKIYIFIAKKEKISCF